MSYRLYDDPWLETYYLAAPAVALAASVGRRLLRELATYDRPSQQLAARLARALGRGLAAAVQDPRAQTAVAHRALAQTRAGLRRVALVAAVQPVAGDRALALTAPAQDALARLEQGDAFLTPGLPALALQAWVAPLCRGIVWPGG